MPIVFRLIYQDGKALKLIEALATSKTYPPTGSTMVEYPTMDAAHAGIATLKLTPCMTPGQKLAAIVGTLPPSDQATYQPLFAPIAALVEAGKCQAAAAAIQALALPDSLTPARAAMLAALKA